MQRYNQVAEVAAGDNFGSGGYHTQTTFSPHIITVGGLLLLLIFPPIIGVVIGLAWGMIENQIGLYVKIGFILGLLTGGGLAAVFLLVRSGFLSSLFAGDTKQKMEYDITVIGQQEQIRLVPVFGSARLVNGIPEEDLIYFIDNLWKKGHTQRKWLGEKMPSGVIVDERYWTRLCQPLRTVRLIQNVAERKKGQLATTDAELIKRRLRLGKYKNLDAVEENPSQKF